MKLSVSNFGLCHLGLKQASVIFLTVIVAGKSGSSERCPARN
jgi:hypothetical protein